MKFTVDFELCVDGTLSIQSKEALSLNRMGINYERMMEEFSLGVHSILEGNSDVYRREYRSLPKVWSVLFLTYSIGIVATFMLVVLGKLTGIWTLVTMCGFLLMLVMVHYIQDYRGPHLVKDNRDD